MPNVTGPVRARDLRANIQELGFEKGVVHTMELLLDEFAGYRQSMRAMAELLDKCIDEVTKLVHIGGEIRSSFDDLRRTITKGEQPDGTQDP